MREPENFLNTNITRIPFKAPNMATIAHRRSEKKECRLSDMIIKGIPNAYKKRAINPKKIGYGILERIIILSSQKSNENPQ